MRGRRQPAALLRQLTPLLLLGQTSRVGSVRLRLNELLVGKCTKVLVTALLRRLTPSALIFPQAMFSFICHLDCIQNTASTAYLNWAMFFLFIVHWKFFLGKQFRIK